MTDAWASVHHIQHHLTLGWLVRGIHHFGSGATVVLLGAHLLQTAIYGAYKRPREGNWYFGLVLFGLVLGLSLTGYLLPWDQKGYWATRVATNIFGTIPGVGVQVQRLAQGGNQYGHLTLTRFYALHVGVLPMAMMVAIAIHVALFRKHGVTPPSGADLAKVDRFYPKQLALDVLAACAVLGVVLALVLRHHGADLDAPADPSSDYPARPEWYFLALFQLLKYFHGPLEIVGTLVVPGVAGGFLVALPFLDRSPTTAVRARLPWLALLGLGLAGVAALTMLARAGDAKDKKYLEARKLADERAAYANELAKKGVPPEGPLVMLARDPQLRGQELWNKACATCHRLGPVAPGAKDETTAPDLQGWGSPAWVEETMRDPDGNHRFGRSPLKGEMPSVTKAPPGKESEFKAMPEAEIKAVASYVAGASDAKGAEVYGRACEGCHKKDGKGGDDSELAPDLTGWGSYRWLRAQIADPADGQTYKPEASTRKNHMPAFAKNVDLRDEIDLVARWVHWKAKGRWPTAEEMEAVSPAASPAPSAAPKKPLSLLRPPVEAAAVHCARLRLAPFTSPGRPGPRRGRSPWASARGSCRRRSSARRRSRAASSPPWRSPRARRPGRARGSDRTPRARRRSRPPSSCRCRA